MKKNKMNENNYTEKNNIQEEEYQENETLLPKVEKIEMKKYCWNRFTKNEFIKLICFIIFCAFALAIIISALVPHSPIKKIIIDAFNWAKKIPTIYSIMFFCAVYFLAMMIMFSSTVNQILILTQFLFFFLKFLKSPFIWELGCYME